MIVECNQCHAKFRLDDTKITDKGVKVRCSKCKHIFTVTKEDVADKTLVASPPPSEPKPPPPRQAAPPPPKPIEDDGLQGFEFKDEPDAPPAGQGFDDGLGDLSFEEPPPPADPPAAPPPETDFGDFAADKEKPAPESSGDMDDFGDFDFDDDISSESESTAPPPAAQQESKDFVSDMPDFGDSEPAPAPQAAPNEPAGTDVGADDFGADDFGGEDFDIGNETAPLPSKSAAPAPGGSEGIDEFGEISFDDAGAGSAPKRPGPPPGASPTDTDNMELDTGVGGRTMDEFKQVAGAEDSYAFNAGGSELPETDIPTARSQSRPEEMESAPPPPTEHPRAKAGKAGGPPRKKRSKKPIVAIIIILLIGAGLFQLNKTGKLDDIKKLSLKDLSFEKIQIALGLKKKELPRNVWEVQVLPGSQGFYSITRADGKSIWVIRGTVTSRFVAGQRAVIVEGKVKDGDLERSAQGVVGAKLTNENLKTMKMDKIKEDLSSPVDENLEPRMLLTDKTMEFVIVFDNISSAKPQLVPPGAQVASSVPL